MPAIYEYQLTVPEAAIDGQGHVNNLEYVRWMQEAAIAHSIAQGWTAARYQEIGAGWVARSHWIEYLHAKSRIGGAWVSDFVYPAPRRWDPALIPRPEQEIFSTPPHFFLGAGSRLDYCLFTKTGRKPSSW
jgi:hypothetical protein